MAPAPEAALDEYVAGDEQFARDDEPLFGFLTKRRAITALSVGFALLLVYALFSDDESDTTNVRDGCFAVGCAFLLFSTIALPDGPFTRPHPVVWRAVLGLSFLYWSLLLFVLFQSTSDVHAALERLDPSLAATRPVLAGGVGGYASAEDDPRFAPNCTVTSENLLERWDIFVLAHYLGWVAKALMLRDVVTCWIVSAVWELTELVFAEMLPNFVECWWDQVLYDVLLCNGLGIITGIWLSRKLEARSLSWSTIGEVSTRAQRGRAALALQLFTPKNWDVLSLLESGDITALKRYVCVVFLVFLSTTTELNAFFLKHIFGVPTKNALNIWRLGLWTLFGSPALRQLYVYMTNCRCKRLGVQAWTAAGVLSTETLVVIKFGRRIFPQYWRSSTFTTGLRVLGAWVCVVVSFTVLCLFLEKRLWRRRADDTLEPTVSSERNSSTPHSKRIGRSTRHRIRRRARSRSRSTSSKNKEAGRR